MFGGIEPWPKELELIPAYLASCVDCALELKMNGFSDMNESDGKVSMAYAGGPVGTPQRLW